ncbi:tetratricopeptide repeat protein [Oscillatoria sp. FACHB-1407]|uniref:tetratricopeptide repeat protein n=1 Tax=Oscillatoria sp. FACHB-1407 TaxID=2692847 RepID=UPI001689DAF7|nr:tetratricopeptide repeat protein [Oscillatoria sp. FACHB-1407]MBD2460861.1 tetratricopeptide repeat protein [Oscillatoria sp. FACHB-1407]
MTDLSFRKILGLNQQTYQRLRVALSLNLRRQIFIAVCDDLALRDRLSARLIEDVTPTSKSQPQQTPAPRYPRLVTLPLNSSDPNPIAQMVQWLTQSPPPLIGNRRAPIPAFQLVGVEQLTREPAAIQRSFLTHLQGIERNLSILESSLILWVPQPWLHTLPDSAPEFWRCRSAVFEFVGDPTPLPAPAQEAPPARSRPPQPIPDPDPIDDAVEAETLASASNGTQEQLWKLLTQDLPELNSEAEPETNGHDTASEEDGFVLQTQTARIAAPVGATSVKVIDAPPAIAVKAKVAAPTRPPAQAPTSPPQIPSSKAPSSKVSPPPPPPKAPSSNAQSHPAQTAKSQANQSSETITVSEADQAVSSKGLLHPSEPAFDDLQSEPMLLMQQIELLHQEQAPPAALAEAYRILGNLYRDRIEQGDVSAQNLTTAIQAYEQVLVWLHETSDWWTDVLNDLGNLYWMLSRYASSPDQALAHLQQGIQAYQLALSKLNYQLQPNAYPMIQNNLGAAYADLARYQDPVENLQRSIQAYQQALRHRKAEHDPLRYASTQNNLGTAYWNLAQHQQPEVYLKQAIAAYSEALHYYNADQEPLSYAMIQNNLGTAYWNLAQHERPQDWLRLALGAYQIALQYRTFATAPSAYAATQNNLGTAYWHLANHSKDDVKQRTEYLQAAIAAYEATLVATEKLATHPQPIPLNFDVSATHNNLGLAHHQLVADPKISLEAAAQSTHLEQALRHHLQALEGWQHKPDFRQTALNCVIQVMRTIYNTGGLAGQNQALGILPGHLLPEVLPKLG